MTTYDFQDGKGPVPAHKHSNGGGWVEDTAQVFDAAYVGFYARVYGNARVSGNAEVYGDAEVHGYARVYGDASVKRGSYRSSPLQITRSDGYSFTLQSDSSVVAGCRDFTMDEALEYWGNPEHHMHKESYAIVQALISISKAKG